MSRSHCSVVPLSLSLVFQGLRPRFFVASNKYVTMRLRMYNLWRDFEAEISTAGRMMKGVV